MASVQKRCRACGRTVGSKVVACGSCGSRDKSWRARYRGPDRKERSRTFSRRVDAERWLTSQEGDKLRGVWLDPALGRIALAERATKWIDAKEADVKTKTADSYRSLLRSRILPAFGEWQIAAISRSDVEGWVGLMRREGVGSSRIRQAHVVLTDILGVAVADGILARNVAVGVDLPPLPTGEAAYLEPADVERIAASMPAPNDLLTRLLGTLGLRYGEAVALRRRSVDLLRRRLVVEQSMAEVSAEAFDRLPSGKDGEPKWRGIVFGETKTHAMRRVPLTPTLARAIEGHLDRIEDSGPEALLFTSPNGGPLRHSNFYHRVWLPALERAGLPRVGVHVLRHSAAAALIASGASSKAVQTILGHRSVAFTLTVYGHLFDTDLDEVAARLDATVAERVWPERGLALLRPDQLPLEKAL